MSGSTSRPRMLIDCDPGHDDAVALLTAARHIDLVAVTTVHGNNTLANTTRNALALLELAGIDVPLAAGCAVPLVQPPQPIATVHGSMGLDGATLPEPRRKPAETHAVDVIIDLASRHRGELVLAILGPHTNVAVALAREPRLRTWLREITIMGGSTERGNVTPAAEFNIHCDPEAAAVVLASGIPMRMVGLNVTRRTGFSDADITRLRGSGRMVAGVCADLMDFYLARQRERRGALVAPMHDVCAIMPYVDATLVTAVAARVDIELAGTFTRGMTVCELPPHGGTLQPHPGANIQMAIDADSPRLITSVIDALLTYP